MHYSAIVSIRARDFSGEPVREIAVLVDSDGSIRVWDAVAHHWTTCHALSPAAQRRARALAAGGRARAIAAQPAL